MAKHELSKEMAEIAGHRESEIKVPGGGRQEAECRGKLHVSGHVLAEVRIRRLQELPQVRIHGS